VTRREQQILRALRSRHGRNKTGMFLCEGLRCCEEALVRRPRWLAFALCSASFKASDNYKCFHELASRSGHPLEALTDVEFAEVALTEHPQGILCAMRQPELAEPDALPDPFALILDRIAEPGNMGTILRTAWAVGLSSVWLTAGSADPFGAKAIRAGMGAQFALSLSRCANLQQAKEAFLGLGGNTLWCAVPREGAGCFSAEFDLNNGGLVIGNEATGISMPALGKPVSIPMPGDAESLNVAQAATVFLFEAVRRDMFKMRCGGATGPGGGSSR